VNGGRRRVVGHQALILLGPPRTHAQRLQRLLRPLHADRDRQATFELRRQEHPAEHLGPFAQVERRVEDQRAPVRAQRLVGDGLEGAEDLRLRIDGVDALRRIVARRQPAEHLGGRRLGAGDRGERKVGVERQRAHQVVLLDDPHAVGHADVRMRADRPGGDVEGV